MTDPRSEHNPHRGGGASGASIDFSRLSRMELIRCAADGEAPTAIVEELERDEHARSSIASERALRDRVAKVMGQGQAPAELRSAIKDAFAREQADVVDARPTVGPEATRLRFFWARRTVVSTLAAAAAVALATLAGVVFLMDANRPLLESEVVSFFEQEHARCAEFSGYFERKMSARDDEQASLLVREALNGESPRLSLSSAGFILAGAGRCNIPGAGPSSHILYRASETDIKRPSFSLFLQVDTGDINLRNDVCYDFVCGPEGRDRLAVWRHGGLIYFAYFPNGAQELPKEALMALGAPAERILLGT